MEVLVAKISNSSYYQVDILHQFIERGNSWGFYTEMVFQLFRTINALQR